MMFMLPEIATYRELEARWKALRSTRDLRVREVACIGAPRTLLCAESGDPGQMLITISAGVHGDERSGPIALLHLAEEGLLDPRFAYRLWPCTNPTGYDCGTRESVDGIDINRTFGRGGQSPEAKAVIMANRDFKFELAIDLHEDCDEERFYFYGYGAEDVSIALETRLDCECLRPDPIAEAEELGGLSYSLLLCRNAAHRAYTFEAPGLRPFNERAQAHIDAVVAAIGALEIEGAASDSQAIRK
jgi:hypothetical protein